MWLPSGKSSGISLRSTVHHSTIEISIPSFRTFRPVRISGSRLPPWPLRKMTLRTPLRRRLRQMSVQNASITCCEIASDPG